MKISVAGIALWLALPVLAGCTTTNKADDPTIPRGDPNTVPPNYRAQILVYLPTALPRREDFRGTLIAPPMLKPVGSSQRMVVCLRFTSRTPPRDKVVIYFAGTITQFVGAKPEQCNDAAYEPFPELEAELPAK